MSAPVPEVDPGLLEVLAAHGGFRAEGDFWSDDWCCTCDWLFTVSADQRYPDEIHRTHLARAVQAYYAEVTR